MTTRSSSGVANIGYNANERVAIDALMEKLTQEGNDRLKEILELTAELKELKSELETRKKSMHGVARIHRNNFQHIAKVTAAGSLLVH